MVIFHSYVSLPEGMCLYDSVRIDNYPPAMLNLRPSLVVKHTGARQLQGSMVLVHRLTKKNDGIIKLK